MNKLLLTAMLSTSICASDVADLKLPDFYAPALKELSDRYVVALTLKDTNESAYGAEYEKIEKDLQVLETRVSKMLIPDHMPASLKDRYDLGTNMLLVIPDKPNIDSYSREFIFDMLVWDTMAVVENRLKEVILDD